MFERAGQARQNKTEVSVFVFCVTILPPVGEKTESRLNFGYRKRGKMSTKFLHILILAASLCLTANSRKGKYKNCLQSVGWPFLGTDIINGLTSHCKA